ncbi:MAG: FAD binding domain-containing protein [Negativicutes bacterium]|nr:FAD binding domain-containing protein [Negativicutes bacterium]
MSVQFFHPGSLQEALNMIAGNEHYTLLAGGTDVIPQMNIRRRRDLGTIVYLGDIAEMRTITMQQNRLFIGAAVTHAQIGGSELVKQKAGNVWQSSYSLGTPAIRNAGTLGGNLVNASPSGDSCVALLAAGAEAVIRSVEQNRVIDLADFFLGKGQTAISAGEILCGVNIPLADAAVTKTFSLQRIGLSKGASTAVLNVAAEMETDKTGRCVACRVAGGAVAPVPLRFGEIERELTGTKVTAELIERSVRTIGGFIAPIDDSYATAAYRRQVAPILVRRALLEASGLNEGGDDSQ